MVNWRAVVVVASLLWPFGVSRANACYPSGWDYEIDGGACLEITHNAEGEPSAKNRCSESIQVSSLDCSGVCPGDMELSPGEERPLELPVNPKDDDSFRLTSNRNDSITFEFEANICPSEEGCSLGARSTDSDACLGALLVAAWVARRQRRADPRCQH